VIARFRSLRWRLTFLYLGLLSVLLLVGGVAQYFAAREVLLRTNADALTSEYKADLMAFRKQIGTRPASAVRALLLSKQFATNLASGHTAAAIFDPNGGFAASAAATTTPDQSPPFLTAGQYLNAAQGKPKPYYLASSSDGATHLVVLNVVRNGTKPVAIVQLSVPTDAIDQALQADRQLAIAGSLLVLLVALLLSPLIVGRALRPLEQMSRTAGALAAGDYKQRVSVPNTGDEIGKLAVAFNQMASGVDQAFEIRRQSEEQMRHFVADASHELRTPLTSIVGYLELALEDDDASQLDPQRRHFLEVVSRNADRLLRLVGDLLFAAQVEAGTLTLERDSVDLARLVRDAVEAAGPRAAAAGIELVMDEPGELWMARADRDRIGQMLDNLVVNALKFTPAGGTVAVRCSQVGDEARLSVSDTGVGIAPGDRERLFDRFFRARDATEQGVPGLGLGLTIVQAIVRGHDGDIAVDSAPGFGTTFRVTMPLRGAGQRVSDRGRRERAGAAPEG
jgi:signal transduction histidine kinase